MPDTTQTNDLDSTINLLQQELASVDIALALNIIERWEYQLQGSDIFGDLMELKQAILNGNLIELENLLRDLGDNTSAIAGKVSQDGTGEVAAKIEQIGHLLAQASRNLSNQT